MGDFLVAGVNTDEDIRAIKGPSILNIKERCEIIKHCKFVDQIAEGTPYHPSEELLD